MVGMTTRSQVRAITATAVAVAAVALLAACSGGGTSTPSRSAAATGGRTASSAPSASATAKPIGERVDTPCETLVPDATFSVYGKTFTLDADATPTKDSTAAAIAYQRGQVCVYQDEADDLTVTVAVAKLPNAALTKLKDTLYEDSNSVPTYTVEGYFDTMQGVGRADAFPDPYWVNAESTMFGEPGDAQPVMDAVRAAVAPGAAASPSAAPTGSATTAPTGTATPAG